MDYTKRPLTLQEQVHKLEGRGLRIEDEQLAERNLSNISYYRLRAYTYPFQNNSDIEADHCFIKDDISFSDIIDLYCFDRRLRTIMFNAIEKIEVSVRAKLAQEYSITTGNSHWYCDESLFSQSPCTDREGNPTTRFEQLMKDIKGEINRSNEDFIKHYKQKYDNPPLPPSWMTLEVLSLGTLSKLYSLLKKTETKKRIAQCYGLNDIKTFENWLHSIAVWRNCCAHHSRIWNRRSIVNIRLPRNTSFPFIKPESISNLHPNKIFTVLCCIKYISNIISPNSDLKRKILSIIGDGGNLLNLEEMGFIKDWKLQPVWK